MNDQELGQGGKYEINAAGERVLVERTQETSPGSGGAALAEVVQSTSAAEIDDTASTGLVVEMPDATSNPQSSNEPAAQKKSAVADNQTTEKE